MALLPDELHPIILSHIWDFALWRDARYVSRRWYKIIIETQPQLIWRFVHAGQLPNGAQHGYVIDRLRNQFANCYDIFQYNKLIAQEAFIDKHTTFRRNIDITGLICFDELCQMHYIFYTLTFLSPKHKRILEFCIDDQLNLYAIAINNRIIPVIRYETKF